MSHRAALIKMNIKRLFHRLWRNININTARREIKETKPTVLLMSLRKQILAAQAFKRQPFRIEMWLSEQVNIKKVKL